MYQGWGVVVLLLLVSSYRSSAVGDKKMLLTSLASTKTSQLMLKRRERKTDSFVVVLSPAPRDWAGDEHRSIVAITSLASSRDRGAGERFNRHLAIIATRFRQIHRLIPNQPLSTPNFLESCSPFYFSISVTKKLLTSRRWDNDIITEF